MKKLVCILIVLACTSVDTRAQAEYTKGNVSGFGILYSVSSSEGNLSHAVNAGASIIGRLNVGLSAVRPYGGDDPTFSFFIEGFPLKQSKSHKRTFDDESPDPARQTLITWGVGASLGRSGNETKVGLSTQFTRRLDLGRCVFLQPAFGAAVDGIGSRTRTTSFGAHLTLGLGDDKDHFWLLLGAGMSGIDVRAKGWTGYEYGSTHGVVDLFLGAVVPFDSPSGN